MDLETTLKEIHVNADEPLKSLEQIFGDSSLKTWLNLGFADALYKCLFDEEKEPVIISKSIFAKFLPVLSAIIPSMPIFLEDEFEMNAKFPEYCFDPALVDNLISKIISPFITMCLRQRFTEPLLRNVFLRMIWHARESTINDNVECFLSESFRLSLFYYFQPCCSYESHTFMAVLILLGRKMPEHWFLQFLNPDTFNTLRLLITRHGEKKCHYVDNLKILYKDLDLENKLEKNVPTWISMHQTDQMLHEPDFTKVLQNISQYVDEEVSYRQFIRSEVLHKLESLLSNPCESFIKSFLEVFIEFRIDSGDQYKWNSNRFEKLVKFIANAIGYLSIILDKVKYGCHENNFSFHSFEHLDKDALAALNILQSLHVLNSSWHQWFDILEERKLINDEVFISHPFNILLKRELGHGTKLLNYFTEMAQTCPVMIFSNLRQKLFMKSLPKLNKYNPKNLKISRNNVLRDVMDTIRKRLPTPCSPWNFGFKDEVGHGSTKEVYSILSRELQRYDINLWQSREPANLSGNELSYVNSLTGLFPKKSDKFEDRSSFRIFGNLLAKAFLDGYRLDIHFSKEFFKHLRLQHPHLRKAYFQLTQEFPLLDSIFKQMLQVKRKIETIRSDKLLSQSQKDELIRNLPFEDGNSFDDLHLNFTVPGTDIEIIEGGRNIILSPNNIDFYLEKLCVYKVQFDPDSEFIVMRLAIDKIVPCSTLDLILPEEIEKLLCAEQFQKWTTEDLFKNCVYEFSSSTQFLFQCLNLFDVKEQRLFLKFATGITSLPFGGLSNLSPPLTISRIKSDNPDSSLPSSATCSNCVYLPDYSSLKVTRENGLYAIREDHDLLL